MFYKKLRGNLSVEYDIKIFYIMGPEPERYYEIFCWNPQSSMFTMIKAILLWPFFSLAVSVHWENVISISSLYALSHMNCTVVCVLKGHVCPWRHYFKKIYILTLSVWMWINYIYMSCAGEMPNALIKRKKDEVII